MNLFYALVLLACSLFKCWSHTVGPPGVALSHLWVLFVFVEKLPYERGPATPLPRCQTSLPLIDLALLGDRGEGVGLTVGLSGGSSAAKLASRLRIELGVVLKLGNPGSSVSQGIFILLICG